MLIHDVDDSNPYFLELFQPDTLDRKCKKCCVVFGSSRLTKNQKYVIIIKVVVQEMV